MSTLTANYIDCLQGSTEWFQCRLGSVTSSRWPMSSPSVSGSRRAKKQKKWPAA
jgi:hypothetical protein